MRVRLLGSAAGGGLPQWNCACQNCRACRAGQIPAQTQSSVAITFDDHSWFLINASPDLHQQIQAFPELHPSTRSPRNSPIAGVLLTDADLDHVLGLLLLREGQPLHLHSSPEVQQILRQDLRIEAILGKFCGLHWHNASANWQSLDLPDGLPSGLSYRAFFLPSTPPVFASSSPSLSGFSIAYQISDQQNRILIAPDVGTITPELAAAMEESDAIFFDGTFWSETELEEIRPGARGASAMGHLPIQSASLELLASLKAIHKVYFHVNNTNPILIPDSEPRLQIHRHGITVGYDGLEIEL